MDGVGRVLRRRPVLSYAAPHRLVRPLPRRGARRDDPLDEEHLAAQDRRQGAPGVGRGPDRVAGGPRRHADGRRRRDRRRAPVVPERGEAPRPDVRGQRVRGRQGRGDRRRRASRRAGPASPDPDRPDPVDAAQPALPAARAPARGAEARRRVPERQRRLLRRRRQGEDRRAAGDAGDEPPVRATRRGEQARYRAARFRALQLSEGQLPEDRDVLRPSGRRALEASGDLGRRDARRQRAVRSGRGREAAAVDPRRRAAVRAVQGARRRERQGDPGAHRVRRRRAGRGRRDRLPSGVGARSRGQAPRDRPALRDRDAKADGADARLGQARARGRPVPERRDRLRGQGALPRPRRAPRRQVRARQGADVGPRRLLEQATRPLRVPARQPVP